MQGVEISFCSTAIQNMDHEVMSLSRFPELTLPLMVTFSPLVSFKIHRSQLNSSLVIAEIVSKNGALLEIKSVYKTIFIEELQCICNAKLTQIKETYKLLQTTPQYSTENLPFSHQNDKYYASKCFIDEQNQVRIGFATVESMMKENQPFDYKLIPVFFFFLRKIDPSVNLLLQRIGIIRASFREKLKIYRQVESSKKLLKKIIRNPMELQAENLISQSQTQQAQNPSGVFEHLNVVKEQLLNENEMIFKRGGYFDIVKRKVLVYKSRDQVPILQSKNLAQKKLSKRKRPNTIYNYEGKIPKELKLLHCLSSLSLYELNFFAKYYFLNFSTVKDFPSQEMIDESECSGKETVSTMSEESQITVVSNVIYMDFYDENLEEYLIRKGKLDIFEILYLIRQIFESVQSLHKVGIVHRDIKPANFMIERLQDGRIKTKLIDFGESAHVASQYDSSEILGFSTQYAPIECTYQCKEGYNAKQIDLWSVGVLIYKLTTNRMPVTYSKCFKSDIKYEWPTSLSFFIAQYGRGRWQILQNLLITLSLMFMKVKPQERLTLEKGLRMLDQIENLAKFYAFQR